MCYPLSLKEDIPNKSNFDLLKSKMFEHEGGISNHPNDSGGYTNKGIIFETFKQYAQKDLGIAPTLANLKKITTEQASIIYKNNFWDPIHADELNSFSVAYALFDFHINAPSNAIKLMQQSVNDLGGNLVIDNKMGHKTVRAINSVDAHQLFNTYQAKRTAYYIKVVHDRPDQIVFKEGWLRRVKDIKFER